MAFIPEEAEIFGRRLKKILREKKLTQVGVRAKTGLSQQAVSGWCRGLHLPRADHLETLAELLEMDPRALCPEAFEGRVASSAQSSISFSPIDTQPGWYVLKIGGMPVDDEMLKDVIEAHRRFGQRRAQDEFRDVKITNEPRLTTIEGRTEEVVSADERALPPEDYDGDGTNMSSIELRRIRAELRMTGDEFALALGTSKSTYRAWERDQSAIPKPVALAVRLLLQTNRDDWPTDSHQRQSTLA